jgi:CubicO group peptidase (beta-lactamase class C family)
MALESPTPVPRNVRALAIIVAALLIVLFTTSPAYRLSAPALPVPTSSGLAAVAPAAPAPTMAARPALAAPPAAAALPSEVPPQGQLATTLDGYLNQLVSAGLFQGVVLVAHDGQVLLNRGYGYADAEQHLANHALTRFQLASMTKPFTALAIMQLQARGLLGLQDSICRYLDDCPVAWQPIVIRQLLNHTAGLPNYTDLAEFNDTQAQPATLGMRDTGTDPSAPAPAGAALGYNLPGERAPLLDPSNLFAAGALYSTSQDLYRFDQALYTEQLLAQPLLDQIWTPGLGGYGYGWKIGSLDRHRKISHPGRMDGFASTIARFPDDRVSVIVLANMSAADTEGIADYIATLVFGSV